MVRRYAVSIAASTDFTTQIVKDLGATPRPRRSSTSSSRMNKRGTPASLAAAGAPASTWAHGRAVARATGGRGTAQRDFREHLCPPPARDAVAEGSAAFPAAAASACSPAAAASSRSEAAASRPMEEGDVSAWPEHRSASPNIMTRAEPSRIDSIRRRSVTTRDHRRAAGKRHRQAGLGTCLHHARLRAPRSRKEAYATTWQEEK
jgi:hypothetical protein